MFWLLCAIFSPANCSTVAAQEMGLDLGEWETFTSYVFLMGCACLF